jgi:hypothetical protein
MAQRYIYGRLIIRETMSGVVSRFILYVVGPVDLQQSTLPQQLCEALSKGHHKVGFELWLSFCTIPTMLYRLLKKVIQSSRTFLSLSSRSCHSGTQSSGFSDERARAREASLPAKTCGALAVVFHMMFECREQYFCNLHLGRTQCFRLRQRLCPVAVRR